MEADDATPRTSGRVRQKSLRVLEHEDTQRALHARHVDEKVTKNVKVPKAKSKNKVKKKRVFCLCKQESDSPMIECDECKDWQVFHFSCIDIQEEEVEKIHKFVCVECQTRTGQRTTYMYDIETFPSPSPPPGISVVQTQQKPRKRIVSASDASESSSDDSSSEAIPSLPSSPMIESPVSTKRRRLSSNAPKRPSISTNKFYPTERKSSSNRSIPTQSPSGLLPMRKYVRDKLAPAIKRLFGDEMDDVKASNFAMEVEVAMYKHFKDVIGGKEFTGTRYKTQFNLLSSSISKGLRHSLLQSIKTHTLSPSQIATLTSSDLASEEQLAEINRAKQASLEQTVKAKNNEEIASIRLGRDGFEKVEDRREKEMQEIREMEKLEKKREEEHTKKASLIDDKQEKDQTTTLAANVPPVATKAIDENVSRAVPRRSESIDTSSVHSPLRQSKTSSTPIEARPAFALTSAWGGGGQADDSLFTAATNQGQMELDFSDIVKNSMADEIDYGYDVDIESTSKSKSNELELFESKPVLWQGGLINPANPSPHVPTMSLRLISRASPHSTDFSILLPHQVIEITGRVPTKASLQFLGDMRLNPSKELITVVLTFAGGSDEERKTWEGIIDYHIGRDRHAIYHPYGPHPPPGGVKELYMIPLRPKDPPPEFTELIDGFSLPLSGRTSPILLGVFIVNKKIPIPLPASPQGTKPLHKTPTSRDPRADLPAPLQTHQPSQPHPATIQNEKLQQLISTLNPASFQHLTGGSTPPTGLNGSGGMVPIPSSSATIPIIPTISPALGAPGPSPGQPYAPYTGYPPLLSPSQPQASGQPPYPRYPPPTSQQGQFSQRQRRHPDNDQEQGYKASSWDKKESDNGWRGRRRY
nr:hypothetical protein L203_01196 [Cryptococcus depauperatus CBS 7841]